MGTKAGALVNGERVSEEDQAQHSLAEAVSLRLNGYEYLQLRQIQAFHMDTVGQLSNCSFNGTYTQRGSLGRVDGNYSCMTGEVGTFTMFAMQWTLYGMSAGISGQNQFCRFDGFLGGITGLHIQ